MPGKDGELTRLLDAWNAGDSQALERLVPIVIDDLRRIARARMAREAPGHTLEPTALVNEVFLKLVGKRSVSWQSRTQFFATMAQTMRRILVDHARRRQAQYRGGDARHVTFVKALDTPAPDSETDGVDLLALDEALQRLAEIDPRQAKIVELRFFGGLTLEETARTVEVSSMTIKREWRTARMWLKHELG